MQRADKQAGGPASLANAESPSRLETASECCKQHDDIQQINFISFLKLPICKSSWINKTMHLLYYHLCVSLMREAHQKSCIQMAIWSLNSPRHLVVALMGQKDWREHSDIAAQQQEQGPGTADRDSATETTFATTAQQHSIQANLYKCINYNIK